MKKIYITPEVMSVLLANSGESLMQYSNGQGIEGYNGGTNDFSIGNGGKVNGNDTEIEAD